METTFAFPAADNPPEAESLRSEVRSFLTNELRDMPAIERAKSFTGIDPVFSRKLGERGWIGMVWPKRYGGQERTSVERYVVLEELLAAGAPVGAHWTADRQSGPQILKYGTDAQRDFFLPRIAQGECYFCIGMSEADAGSDLAAVRTFAAQTDDGFLVNGSKLWTSNAHICDYMVLFCRTENKGGGRHDGFSQFIVDLRLPGITINPIVAMSGDHHFNEVVLDNVILPSEALLGELGDGWRQVTSELALERSGPERFLSSFVLMAELVKVLRDRPSDSAAIAVGRMGAHLVTLRDMSRSIAAMLQEGKNPVLQASIVKDLGAVFEQEIPEISRQLRESGGISVADSYRQLEAYMQLSAPAFSLRGGTREILRGIIARGLGLR
jgi:alkylation response protein AidB-like acyl-CoA dehydrogenase